MPEPSPGDRHAVLISDWLIAERARTFAVLEAIPTDHPAAPAMARVAIEGLLLRLGFADVLARWQEIRRAAIR